MSSLFICFFGYVIATRLFSAFFSRFNLEKKILRGFFYLLLIFDLFVITFAISPIFVWSWHILLFVIVILSPRAVELQLDCQLRDSAVTFLDQIILSVQTGVSLRSAIKSAIDQETGWKHHELIKAYSFLVMTEESSSLSSPFLQDLFSEIRWIDQTRARTLEQLKSLRWHYKIQQDFRRKSGQVSQQSRIQALVVTILYLGLLCFNIYHFGFFKNLNLIVCSFGLFVTGLILIFVLGRRIKWKV